MRVFSALPQTSSHLSNRSIIWRLSKTRRIAPVVPSGDGSGRALIFWYASSFAFTAVSLAAAFLHGRRRESLWRFVGVRERRDGKAHARTDGALSRRRKRSGAGSR